jgi:hypothetical protein
MGEIALPRSDACGVEVTMTGRRMDIYRKKNPHSGPTFCELIYVADNSTTFFKI